MKIFNLYAGEWDDEMEHKGFSFRESFVGDHVGSELIGARLYEVPPGRKMWPYHTHHANEEWAIVVGGAPTLRTPEGERELTAGDVVCFVRGAEGAHQVRNDTDAPVQLLMLSTRLGPEVLEYPDSGKTAATDAKGNRLFRARLGEPLEYWDGEE